MSRVKSVSTLIVLLGVIGWAEPLHAQALNLPLNANLFSSIGSFNQQLQATGGTPPYVYSVTPGFTAPPGSRVQNGQPLPTNFPVSVTGGLLGVFAQAGTFPTSIRVVDSLGATFDRPTTVTVLPTNMSSNPPKATLSVPYSFTMTGFGGSGYSWSATNLPPGLTISSAGVVSGTPTAAGSFTANISITSASPSSTRSINLAFIVDPYAITTPGLLPNATAGVFYSQTLSAPGCGGTCTWTPTGFAGLTLNSAGVLSGTPFAQTGSFAVTVAGSNGIVTKQFALFVTSGSPLQSGFGGFGDQTVGSFITALILPFGGTPPYSASVVSGTLPTGISLVGPGETVCGNCAPSLPYLAGRAMQVGTYTFTLKFTDSAGGSFTPPPYTWNISPLSNSYFTLPLAGTTLTVGTPYTQPLLVIGGSNSYTFQAFNALPAGLSINTNTGVISGTPTTGGNLTTQIRISEGGIVKLTAFIQFNVTGPPTVVTLPATNVTNASARLNGTVNPSGLATTGNFEWGTTTAYGNTTSTVNFGSSFFTQTTGTDITCVAGSVYHYRLVATNSQGARQGADQTVTCGAPQVFTFNPFDITARSATLNGGVNPNGLPTTANYQWGLTNAYGNSTPVQSVGSGTSQVFIDGGEITGLSCGTVYHFRATATNANGTSFGNDIAFSAGTCSPGAYTGVATVVGMTTANLIGAANPNGTATTAKIQWGTTTAYGNETPAQSMGSGFDIVPLHNGVNPIDGLTCNTTYHMRTVATNSFGTSNGDDRAFMTAPCVAGSFKGIVYALNQYAFTNLIYAYGVSSAGTLTQLPGFPMPTGGAGDDDDEGSEQLAYDSAKGRLYAINILSNTLSAFSVNPRTGALTPMPYSPIPLPPGGWSTVDVHPSGSPVVVGDFLGSVASFAVTATTATLASSIPSGVPLVFSTAFSRDGNYLYIGAGDGVSGNPSTAGFSVAPGTGVLTPLPGSPFALGGVYPVGYATDASGRLFSVNYEGNQVRAFTTAGGVPTPVAGNPFPAPGFPSNGVAGVVHPAGFYIAAQAADGNSKVGVFQIAGSGGSTTLTSVAGSPFMTGGSGDNLALALSKEGNLLLAANSGTRNLTVFGVNSGTGALTTLTLQPADTLSNFGPITGVAFAPSGPPSSLVVDFGAPYGIWIRRGTTWSQVHPYSAEALLTITEDGNQDGLIIDFGPGVGLWVWFRGAGGNDVWFQLHTLSPTAMVGIDLNGNGEDDSGVFVFPGQGLWLYDGDNDVWSHLHGLDPSHLAVANLDGNPGQELIVDFPGYGLWAFYRSSGTWAPLHPFDVSAVLTADLDGNGTKDLVVNFPGYGVWSYRNGVWARVHPFDAKRLAAGDLDGNGVTDLVVDFGATYGVWRLMNRTTWAPLHGLTTEGITIGDVDGNGHDEVIIDFGGAGIWSHEDIGGWQQVHTFNPKAIATGRFF